MAELKSRCRLWRQYDLKALIGTDEILQLEAEDWPSLDDHQDSHWNDFYELKGDKEIWDPSWNHVVPTLIIPADNKHDSAERLHIDGHENVKGNLLVVSKHGQKDDIFEDLKSMAIKWEETMKELIAMRNKLEQENKLLRERLRFYESARGCQ